VGSYRHGITSIDSVWYHLPFAARFVQQGTVLPLHYVDSEPVTVFFPATSELVHALGMLLVGSDLLSPLVNLGWLALALVAAWCVGRPAGVAPVTTAAVTALLVTPGLVDTQPGGAYDDVTGLALLLAAVALLVLRPATGPVRHRALVLAGLSAGLAVGTKYTFLPAVGLLTVAVVVAAGPGRRVGDALRWLVALTVTGSFWYLRNLAVAGNPLPSLRLRLGPLHLPSPKVVTPTSDVARFLFDAAAWRQFLLPGLRLSFGPVWWALLGLSAAGLVLAGVGPGRPAPLVRLVAAVGAASAVAFVLTPQYLTILGAPVYFVDNVRYADPAIVLGLVVLPLAPAVRRGRRPWWLLGAAAAVVGATQLDATLWPLPVLHDHFGPSPAVVDCAVGVAALAVGIGGWLTWRRLGRRRRRPAAAATLAVVAAAGVAASVGVQQYYLQHRYAAPSSSIPYFPQDRAIHHARIAVAGTFMQLQYPLYGTGLSNVVQYVAQPEPHHGYEPITSCRRWRQAVDAGRYRYVQVSGKLPVSGPKTLARASSFLGWTASDPAAQLVAQAGVRLSPPPAFVYALFRLRRPLNPAACGPPAASRPG
jgi:hypothetical protein